MNATRASAFGAWKQQAAAFWEERNRRERILLVVGGVALLAALFYVLLIDPALSGRTDLAKRLPVLRQQAAELQALSKDASSFTARASAPVPQMTRESLEASLSRQGLRAQNISMAGDDTARVQFNGAAFSSIVGWLDQLHRSTRISVIDATIEPQTQPDTVNAGITLRQQGGQMQ